MRYITCVWILRVWSRKLSRVSISSRGFKSTSTSILVYVSESSNMMFMLGRNYLQIYLEVEFFSLLRRVNLCAVKWVTVDCAWIMLMSNVMNVRSELWGFTFKVEQWSFWCIRVITSASSCSTERNDSLINMNNNSNGKFCIPFMYGLLHIDVEVQLQRRDVEINIGQRKLNQLPL
jgi:hypothetical protein